MTFEEYKNKMDQITEMQCKSDDQTILQRIRNEMEEKYPELAEQYRNWLWEQLEKENN